MAAAAAVPAAVSASFAAAVATALVRELWPSAWRWPLPTRCTKEGRGRGRRWLLSRFGGYIAWREGQHPPAHCPHRAPPCRLPLRPLRLAMWGSGGGGAIGSPRPMVAGRPRRTEGRSLTRITDDGGAFTTVDHGPGAARYALPRLSRRRFSSKPQHWPTASTPSTGPSSHRALRRQRRRRRGGIFPHYSGGGGGGGWGRGERESGLSAANMRWRRRRPTAVATVLTASPVAALVVVQNDLYSAAGANYHVYPV